MYVYKGYTVWTSQCDIVDGKTPSVIILTMHWQCRGTTKIHPPTRWGRQALMAVHCKLQQHLQKGPLVTATTREEKDIFLEGRGGREEKECYLEAMGGSEERE